jgi:AraC-like DNA-binding protein
MPATLPRLAFGEAQATPEEGVEGLSTSQRVAHRSLISYEPLGRDADFLHKSAVVTIDSLRLAASAHTPIRVTVEASDDIALVVPFAGWSTAVIEGREHRWLAGRSAMYLPGVPRRGEAGLRSTLAIGLERARLEQAARSVACHADSATIRAALATPRPVPLAQDGFSFAKVLRQICGLIDNCSSRPDQLALLGVDDMIYRAVAMLLLPSPALAGDAAATRSAGRQPIERACDYALAHLFTPIRLEDLEAASGLKARALQLAFIKHHGLTPRQWILDRRLDAARARLADPQSERTVTSVALECGFTRLSSFSRAYEARFGELPSTTVARRS